MKILVSSPKYEEVWKLSLWGKLNSRVSIESVIFCKNFGQYCGYSVFINCSGRSVFPLGMINKQGNLKNSYNKFPTNILPNSVNSELFF